MQSLNIVNLIETNPITKLTNTYNGKLLTKIKDNFTDMEQQLFVTSFYCYLNYNQTTDFVIDLDNIWKWLGFQQKTKCKILLEKHFVIEIDYKILLSQPGKQKEQHGGHNKETFMLTVKTFKLLCIKAETRKAKEIHEYFIKLEEILQQIILEESDELKKQLEQAKIDNKVEKEVEKKMYEKNCCLAKHNTFCKAYDKKYVVYVCKMKQDEKDPSLFIIKIGSTQNIKQRLSNITKEYVSCEPYLLDIFQCEKHTTLENMIHNSEIIKKYRYVELMKQDGKNAREMYIVNDEIYKHIIETIDTLKISILDQVNNEELLKIEEMKNENEKLRLESEKLLLKRKEIELEMMKLKNTLVFAEETEKEKPEQQISSNTILPLNYIKKRNNGIKVPKVYQYEPTDLKKPVHIFDSPSELERTLQLSQCSLKRASQENTIYRDFRWLYVNRQDSPPNELEPTVETKHKSSEVRYIAMIDIKKTKIMQVFSSQKEAVEARNMKCNSFTRAIQQQTISSGHYWNFFDECSLEMKSEYLKSNTLPEKRINTMGKKIQRIDPQTDSIVEILQSKRDVVKKYQLSFTKLNALVNTEEIYNGYRWKYV